MVLGRRQDAMGGLEIAVLRDRDRASPGPIPGIVDLAEVPYVTLSA